MDDPTTAILTAVCTAVVKLVCKGLVALFKSWQRRPTRPPPDATLAAGQTAAAGPLPSSCIPSSAVSNPPPAVRSDRYNIAVCGDVCAGKSSLVNAILGLKDNAPGAAVVSAVETRFPPTEYEVPDAYVSLCDLPGSGTKGHPEATYYPDNGLAAFDAVLVVVNDTLRTANTRILAAARAQGQPVAVVVSKADEKLLNIIAETGLTGPQAAQRLRETVLGNLGSQLGEGVRVFILSRGGLRSDGFYSSQQRLRGVEGMDEAQLTGWLEGLAEARHDTLGTGFG